MTYETYRYIFVGAAALCCVMLVVTVLLFILLKIPRVIGDLSGATARKAIAGIRQQNTETEDKTSSVNRTRGRLTDKISPSGRIQASNVVGVTGVVTEKNSTQKLKTTEETTLLEHMTGNETTVLSAEAGNETTVLTQGVDGVQIEFEITFVHTDELIKI